MVIFKIKILKRTKKDLKNVLFFERLARIELASSAWKADIIPLYNSRKSKQGFKKNFLKNVPPF